MFGFDHGDNACNDSDDAELNTTASETDRRENDRKDTSNVCTLIQLWNRLHVWVLWRRVVLKLLLIGRFLFRNRGSGVVIDRIAVVACISVREIVVHSDSIPSLNADKSMA